VKTIKSWITNIVLGLISSAIFAFLIAPDQQVQLGSLAVGLISIPIALALAAAAVALYAIYAIVHLVEVIAVKTGVLDLFDAGS
jgi:hypothetical protein